MGRFLVLVAIALLLGGLACPAVNAGASGTPFSGVRLSVSQGNSRPLERQMRRGARETLRWVKRGGRVVVRSLLTWVHLLVRAAKFVLLAFVFTLADRRLIEAWRRRGLGVLRTYVPLLLLLHFRLLVDPRVSRYPKILLAGAIVYGVSRFDVLPDYSVVPGLLDDCVVIAGAVRLFQAACPPRVVDQVAARIVARYRSEGVF